MYYFKKKSIIIWTFMTITIVLLGGYLFLGNHGNDNNQSQTNKRLLVSSENIDSTFLQEEHVKYENIKHHNNIEEEIAEMEQLSRQWLVNNIKTEGSFVYRQNIQGRESDDDSAIRQLLTFRVIAKLCQDGDEKFCDIHRRNLDFVFKRVLKEKVLDDGTKVAYLQLGDNPAKLGSNALMSRLLLVSPYYEQYKTQVKELIEGILSLRDENGQFYQPFFSEVNIDNKEKWLKFYSGESILAMLEYYNKTGDEDILAMAKKSQEYYKEKYINNIDTNYRPAYVPWQTMSLYKLWRITNDPSYIDDIFILNDKLIKMQNQYDTNRGRFFDGEHLEYGKPHSASDAIYTESLVTAYEAALEVGDEIRQKRYSLGIKLSLDNLAKLQVCNKDNFITSKVSSKLCGMFLVSIDANYARIDSLAHTMDFLFALKEVLDINNN